MNMCRKSAVLLWLAILCLWLTACTEHKPVPRPEVKTNPTPKERYEIVLTLQEDPGGSVSEVKGLLAHKISNRECMPVDYTRSLGGSRPMLFEDTNIQFKEIADRTYASVIDRDRLIDENYYGLGTCKWQIDALSIRLYIDGRPYTFGMGGIEIAQNSSVYEYCIRPGAVKSGGGTYCGTEAAINLSQYNRNEFFKISLVSKRI